MIHRLLAVFFMSLGFCMAAYAAPHVHGAATLQIAIDGKNVGVTLISPLESLLGFERAPRNDKEHQAVQKMMMQLNNPAVWLIPSAAARCTPAKPQVNAPALESKRHKSHGHGPHEKHDEEHAELEVIISFHCAEPAALRTMEVRLFDAFPRLQRLQAEVAAPGKQAAANLTRERNVLSW